MEQFSLTRKFGYVLVPIGVRFQGKRGREFWKELFTKPLITFFSNNGIVRPSPRGAIAGFELLPEPDQLCLKYSLGEQVRCLEVGDGGVQMHLRQTYGAVCIYKERNAVKGFCKATNNIVSI